MKKRKGEVVGQEGNILKKAKVSDFTEAEENNNNKHIQLVRTVKVLLQKEQTRLSGMLKFYIQFISCCFEIHVWDWNCNFVSQMMCKSCIPAVQKLDSPIHWVTHYQRISVSETNYAIHKIEIFPVDSVISLSNNSGPRFLSIVTVSNVLVAFIFGDIIFIEVCPSYAMCLKSHKTRRDWQALSRKVENFMRFSRF